MNKSNGESGQLIQYWEMFSAELIINTELQMCFPAVSEKRKKRESDWKPEAPYSSSVWQNTEVFRSVREPVLYSCLNNSLESAAVSSGWKWLGWGSPRRQASAFMCCSSGDSLFCLFISSVCASCPAEWEELVLCFCRTKGKGKNVKFPGVRPRVCSHRCSCFCLQCPGCFRITAEKSRFR